MNFETYRKSLVLSSPPEINNYLLALWHDKKGNWSKAHEIAQDIPNGYGSWIHAYLHRKEGDLSNAGYWYDKAGRTMPVYSLDEEWNELVLFFISDGK